MDSGSGAKLGHRRGWGGRVVGILGDDVGRVVHELVTVACIPATRREATDLTRMIGLLGANDTGSPHIRRNM